MSIEQEPCPLCGNQPSEVTALRAFIRAYDEWAHSPEHLGGRRFDAMLEARGSLPDGDGPCACSTCTASDTDVVGGDK